MYSIQFNRRLCGYIEKSRRPTADHVTRGEAAAPSFFFYFLLSIFLKSPGLLLSSCPYSSASLSLSLCVHNNCIAQIYSELRERERLRKREEEEDNRSRATNELFTRLSDGLEEELDRQRPRKKEGDMAKHVAYCENLTQRIAERTGDVSRDLEQRRRYQCTDTRDALFSLFLLSTHRQTLQTKTDSEWLEQSARLPSLSRHPLIS